jgi:hypothetical protein
MGGNSVVITGIGHHTTQHGKYLGGRTRSSRGGEEEGGDEGEDLVVPSGVGGFALVPISRFRSCVVRLCGDEYEYCKVFGWGRFPHCLRIEKCVPVQKAGDQSAWRMARLKFGAVFLGEKMIYSKEVY